MKQITFYSEMAYLIGVLTLALGTALMASADFGVSMVVAPAYLIYLKLSQTLPFMTFGMAEYMLQGVLLVFMILLLRRFRVWYLFSFVTAVFYGIMLDFFMFFVRQIDMSTFGFRLFYYVIGFIICTMGVAFVFKTYIAPAVYELFVKEISRLKGWQIHKFKLVYDTSSCLVAITMSFMFFGWMAFEGIKWGTVIVAFLNGGMIGIFSKIFERVFVFKDRFALGIYFTEKEKVIANDALPLA